MGIAKRVILVLLGFVPLLLGYLIDYWMTTIWQYNIPWGLINLISFAILVLWFAAGLVFVKLAVPKGQVVSLLNIGAFAALILLILQTVQSMWLNQLGIASQMFYLPLIRLGMWIVPSFIVGSMRLASIISFIFLVLVSFLGTKAGARKLG